MIVPAHVASMELMFFWIHEKIKQYFALGNDLDSANWLSIANALGTTDYFQVQEEIHKYALLEE